MGTLSKDDLTRMVRDLEVELRDAKSSEGEQSRRYRQAEIEHRMRRRQLDRLIYIEAEHERRANLTAREVVDEAMGR